MNDDLGTIGAKVTLNTKPYDDGIVHIDQTTRNVLGKLSGLAVSLFGIGAIKNFVEDSVKAFITQEDAVNGLERALQRIGKGSYSDKLQEVAKNLQEVTTYGDEATLKIMKLGVNMGVEVDQLEAATRAAMGLAAGFDNIGIETAMQLIGKAANGNTAMLAKYGIKLDQTKPKMEQFNELLKKGNDLFKLAEAQTFGQRLMQLRNIFGDLQEQIGEMILITTGFYDSIDDLRSQIIHVTDVIKENMLNWSYQIRYVFETFRVGFEYLEATVEPIVTYVVQIFTDAGYNIIAIGQWVAENFDKIIDNFPEIIIALCKDILMLFVNLGETLVDLFKNTGIAIWDALFNGTTDGFGKILDDLKADWNRTMIEMGQFTAKAFEDAGVTLFPELRSTASMDEVIRKYSMLGQKYNEIDAKHMERIANLDNTFVELWNKRREKAEDGTPVDPTDIAGQKNNVVGSFSSAILAGMFGANSPEAQTAKNTKKMVDLQRDLNDSFDEAFTYG